jgi:flagellar motor protein MotB
VRARHEPELPFGSFADALSGMLFVFILTTFWFAWQLADAKAKAEKEKEEAKKQTDTIVNARDLAVSLTEEGKQQKWTLTQCLRRENWVDPRPSPKEPRIFLYLPGVEWFEKGRAALDTEARTRGADEIRTCIEELIAQDSVKSYRIRVYLEGHTDSDQFVGSGETNWELSGRRSAAVVRHVLNGSAPKVMEALAADELEVIAVGMADTRPAWQRLCEQAEAVDEQMCQRLGEGEKLPPIEVKRWANREQDRSEAGHKRRGYLRRVDLRLELLPRIPEDES